VTTPFISNVKKIKRLWITHLLNVLIEIVDHPSLIEVLIHIFLAMSISKINKNQSMEIFFVAFKVMQ
jgi:hypothetical protein